MPSTMFLTMVLCFALSISVAVSIGLASLVGAWQANLNLLAIVKEMFGAINKFPLAAIPFFILAGNLMNASGITDRIITLAKVMTGWITGGLAQVAIVVSALMGGVSGSAVADAAMEARILGPAMLKSGFSRGFTCAVIAVTISRIRPMPNACSTAPMRSRRRL